MNPTVRPLAFAVLAAATLLAGCMGVPAGGGGPAPLTPTQRFSLQVEPGLERIALAVHDNGLSGSQHSALLEMVDRFLIEGAPVLRVEAPSGADPVANDFAWRVRGALEASGAPGHRIQVVAYNAPDPRAPVLIGYDTMRAVVPQCGTHWTSLTRTNSNETPPNFGCAVTANLAAQIANPRDIVQPRGMTPGDAGRRTVVFDLYRKGEATAAPQEELVANRRVSQAVD
jgi:pilus assembly protein CpaD